MSTENWFLKLIRETHNFEREKYHYLELDMPLDPNNPNGLKVSNKYKKLIHTDAESVLEFIVEYNGIVEDLNIPDGVARFRLFEALIHSNAAKSAWSNIRDLHTENNQPTLELCIDLWTLKSMTRDISLERSIPSNLLFVVVEDYTEFCEESCTEDDVVPTNRVVIDVCCY